MIHQAILATAILLSQTPKVEVKQIPNDQIIQQQLDAYNSHDLNRFTAFYSDDIQTINLSTGKIYDNGIEELKKSYSDLFAKFPKLKATVVSRIIQYDFIIDKEVLEGTNSPVVFATAIYQIKNGKIVKVWFL